MINTPYEPRWSQPKTPAETRIRTTFPEGASPISATWAQKRSFSVRLDPVIRSATTDRGRFAEQPITSVGHLSSAGKQVPGNVLSSAPLSVHSSECSQADMLSMRGGEPR